MILQPGLYGGDDVEIGQIVETGSLTVSEDMITRFADLTGDRFEIHMDREAASRHGFDARVAHGILVQGLADGLKNNAPAQFKARASLRWEVDFTKTVLAGDEIRARIRIADKRGTRTDGQCILTLEFDVTNQRDEPVMKGRNLLLAYK